MKRYGNLYATICSMDNLRIAHHNAKKGKEWYSDVRKVEEDVEGHLAALQQMLLEKTYHTSEYTTFIKKDSQKERMI